MELTVESVKGPSRAKARGAKASAYVVADYAAEEINAYISIRDQLLQEAEKNRTGDKLDSVLVANNFVAGCLRHARGPYAGQCLPERDAVRERERCISVTARIAQLRAGTI